MDLDKVLEFKYGRIMQNMKVNGEKIWHTVRENFGMQMVMCTMENGKKIKLMVMEFTSISMGLSMKESGSMISKTVKAWKVGKMEAGMKEDTKEE